MEKTMYLVNKMAHVFLIIVMQFWVTVICFIAFFAAADDDLMTKNEEILLELICI